MRTEGRLFSCLVTSCGLRGRLFSCLVVAATFLLNLNYIIDEKLQKGPCTVLTTKEMPSLLDNHVSITEVALEMTD